MGVNCLLIISFTECLDENSPVESPGVEGWPRGCLVMRRHVRGWKRQLVERRGVVNALLQDFHLGKYKNKKDD